MRNLKYCLYRFSIYILTIPIRIFITLINYLRIQYPSDILKKLFSQSRTDIQTQLSKIIDLSFANRLHINPHQKLTYLDIGARGGLPAIVSNNVEYFNKIILCEGEKTEVQKLRDSGYLVIDKFLSDSIKNQKFYYVKAHPSASSLKKPGTQFLHLFSDTHYKTYTDYIEFDVTTSTLDIELNNLNIQAIDYIKIDVQGSELQIIKGLTTINPLFWEIEVLPFPTYEDVPYGAFITTELINRGYICFRQKDRKYKDGMLIFSNELYMPDYTKHVGKSLIINNLERWKIMMNLFDVNDLAKHIEQRLN